MVTSKTPQRDAGRRVVDRIQETDLGAVIVLIDKDGLPTVYPLGLNMPGRLKALGSAVATLAREVPQPVAATLKSAATQIGHAAEKLLL